MSRTTYPFWQTAPKMRLIVGTRSALLAEQHRKLARAAHRAFRPGDLAGGIEPEIGNPLQPFLDRHRHFHAREVGADTAVNAEPERGMAVFLAVDHHLVCIREHRRI